MIRVLIADDHPIVRKGLAQIFEDVPDIVVAAEAADSNAVLQALETVPCDVVLLDLSMPGAGGLEIIREIRRTGNTPAVLVLSVHPEERFGLRALKAGAAGYLTKESPPDLLIEALRKIHQGQKFITATMAQLMAMDLEDHGEAPHEKLSDREFQVLRMLAQGHTVSSIAEELGLSVKTISTYRSRLLRKMHMKNNAELAHYAIRHELLE